MADRRFFEYQGPIALGKLAELSECRLQHPEKGLLMIDDVSTLEEASSQMIACFHNTKYMETYKLSKAGAIIIREQDKDLAPPTAALLISADPYRSFALVAHAFYPKEAFPGIPEDAETYIHEKAIIDPSTTIEKGAHIEAGAVIGAEVIIGKRCFIGTNSVIERGVQLGEGCYIGPSATISHALIGRYVVIHTGARIGRAGFGFAPGKEKALRVPQLGRVVIEDYAEIGANSTIDRGSLQDTIIGAGSMIDNLVQLGHNVQIGRGCIIVSQAGISGSTKLGDYVQIGGQAGLTGHLSVGTGAKIAAQSGIMRDIDAGAVVCGAPAVPIKDFYKQTLTMWRLAKIKGA